MSTERRPPAPLLFQHQEARLAPLDDLGRGLWLFGLVHSQGWLEPRLAGIAELATTLVAGRLPAPGDWHWPAPALAAPLAAALETLRLPAYCNDQAELTETILRSLLWHLDQIVSYQDRGATAERAGAMAIDAFREDWAERCGLMDELVDVFGQLPDMPKHTRWDLMLGLLRSAGWQEVVRIRRLIERMPELAGIIRGLGRARQTDDPEDASETPLLAMEQSTALRAHTRSVRVPDLPGETRGIRRSGRVARMLPAEAMLLAHPRLRLVWHARHAERTLLTYEDDDRMQETLLQEAPIWRPSPEPQPRRRLEMGPMLVCVDTSGSMQGGAEEVAKAVVLEAVRTAHAQKRPCHVFAFGGPDEVVEMELGADAEGLARLTRFLGQAFRGGTDICGPLERALAKLREERWHLADLLIATDGEFGATPALAQSLRQTREQQGLRVQGILIGDRETIGLLEITDHIHWVRDWRHYGAAAAESPMPTKSLTAMYFPGALRTPENRTATVGGDAAAQAVRIGQRARPH